MAMKLSGEVIGARKSRSLRITGLSTRGSKRRDKNAEARLQLDSELSKSKKHDLADNPISHQ